MTSLKGTRITWLGHATVLVQTAEGTNILIDPFIQHNPKYPKDFSSREDSIHSSTHGHGDHMSDAVPVAQSMIPMLSRSTNLPHYVDKEGAQSTIGMNIGGTVQLEDVAVNDGRSQALCGREARMGRIMLGVAAGFVLTITDGPVLYHAGDTTVFSDMKLIKELYHPELRCCPSAASTPWDQRKQQWLRNSLRRNAILPIHFGTFPPLTGTPEDLVALLKGAIEVIRIAPGETI